MVIVITNHHDADHGDDHCAMVMTMRSPSVDDVMAKAMIV